MSENVCVSKRAGGITPFLVMDVLEAAHKLEAAGHNVIHLEIGEPDFDTPECIKEAAKKALADGETHYTHSLGLLPLREAICEDYRIRYGVTVHPDQIIVTQGTSPAMLLLFFYHFWRRATRSSSPTRPMPAMIISFALPEPARSACW